MRAKFTRVEEARSLALQENMYKNRADRYIKELRERGWNISYSKTLVEPKVAGDLLAWFLGLSEVIDTGDVRIQISNRFDVVPGEILVDAKASLHNVLTYIKN